MTAVLPRPRRADVRARILAAASRAFFEHGYAETKLADIAAEAGFTKGAVYSNFGGKPELFSAVFAERAASITGIALSSSGLLTDAAPAPAVDPGPTTGSRPSTDSGQAAGTGSGPSPSPGHGSDEAVEAVAASLTAQVTDASAGPTALAEFRGLAVRDADVRAAYAALRTQQRAQLEEQLRARTETLGLSESFDFTAAANLLLTVTDGLATEHAAAPEATPPQLIHDSLVLLLRSLIS